MSTFDDCFVLYLHGFASGPASTKAQYFKRKLEQLGFVVRIPDLNGDSFERLTLTGQLAIVDNELKRASDWKHIVLIGSSMGGLLATIAAQSIEQLQGLILLAPGFGLPRRWEQLLGADALLRWSDSGVLDVFHYGAGKNMPLRYEFIVDAQQHQTDEFRVGVATIVFHGRNDQTVPVQESVRFAELNPETVELQQLEDGHELIDSLETIWSGTENFLDRILSARSRSR